MIKIISSAEYDRLIQKIIEGRRTEIELAKAVHEANEHVKLLYEMLHNAYRRINWLVMHFPIAADSLIFVYQIDGVTFKSKHMSLTLPAGKQVLLTIKGSGVDAQNNRVEAPVTSIGLAVSGTGLAVINNPDGTFTLKYVSDETGTLTANATNSLGSPVSGTDSYTTGGTPPPPVVADSLTFNYGQIEDIPA